MKLLTANYKGAQIKYYNYDSGIYIYTIFSDEREKGYGTRAMEKFINRYSHRSIFLFATPDFEGIEKDRLFNFYKRLGFKHVRGQYILVEDLKVNFIID